MAKHAVLAASAAHRWIKCPPSVEASRAIPATTSTYAEEGTTAHAFAELVLADELTRTGYHVLTDPKSHDPTTSEYFGPAMVDYIEGYVAQVLEHAAALGNPSIVLEQRVRFGDYVPGGFGTSDVVLLAEPTMEIIDLKYGQGVRVEAQDNPQLMLYALGAVLEFEPVYDVETVQMTILQPRLDHISTAAISKTALFNWAENVVKPAAALAAAGKGDFAAGDWCRFCPVGPTCRARSEANMVLARERFKDVPAALTDEEVADLLGRLDEWTAWAKALKDYAESEALRGTHYPGWKLVRGRSNRKYSDEAEVLAALEAAGFETETVSRRKLLGITEMERAIGKKAVAALGELIIKPPGKPVLVPADDKRDAWTPAKEAFADFIKGEATE